MQKALQDRDMAWTILSEKGVYSKVLGMYAVTWAPP